MFDNKTDPATQQLIVADRELQRLETIRRSLNTCLDKGCSNARVHGRAEWHQAELRKLNRSINKRETAVRRQVRKALRAKK